MDRDFILSLIGTKNNRNVSNDSQDTRAKNFVLQSVKSEIGKKAFSFPTAKFFN